MSETSPTEPASVAAALAARGTRLRPPASHDSLARLEFVIGGKLSVFARQLYTTFDGFEDGTPDNATMISLWATDLIYERLIASSSSKEKCVIGDYFIAADLLQCDIRWESSPVLWAEHGTLAAPTFMEFCRCLGDGTFKP